MSGRWEPLDKKDLSKGAKVVASTLIHKKKSNSTHQVRLNARGFKQIAAKHFGPTSTTAPVTNNKTIRIVMVFMLLASFWDKFGAGKKKQGPPAEPNTVLKRPEPGEILANKDQSKYQSGIEKMMHMMRWSRPDMYNLTHYNATICIMDCCVTNAQRQ